MDEQLILQVTRLQQAHTGIKHDTEIVGDARFIWEELGVLLVDPLLVKISLERKPSFAEDSQTDE